MTISLASLALLVSTFTFIDTHRRHRRDTYLKIYELLISEDRQYGRQLLFQKVTDEESVSALTTKEYRLINRALSTYELLGLFLSRKYISSEDVMTVWARPICRAWKLGNAFVQHRQAYIGPTAWRYYEELAGKALEYVDKSNVEVNYNRF
ncbi:MAG TPA: hypothetical protein VGP24_09460 [Glaciihabitans sp.]|nr:hypothetical protein [Glaciihabitans sp.]